jgi:hypothetical protein
VGVVMIDITFFLVAILRVFFYYFLGAGLNIVGRIDRWSFWYA